jgi:hypothetical protein
MKNEKGKANKQQGARRKRQGTRNREPKNYAGKKL